jgi:hypothetical protein
VEIIKIINNVYCLKYPTLNELSNAFVRIQEYYDGIFFKDEIFELKEFITMWSEKKGDGKYTYPEFWNGYNVPGTVLEKWLTEVNCKSSIRNEEQALIEKVKVIHCSNNLKNCYVFGITDETAGLENKIVTEHETAHALYYLFPKYRKKCNSWVKKLPKEFLQKAQNYLLNRGYNRLSFNDEIQAYLSSDDLQTGILGIKTLNCKLRNVNILKVFREYFIEFTRSSC